MTDQLTDEALLPCPFCGGVSLHHYDDVREPFVQCRDCDAFGPNGSIAAWNRRAAPADDLRAAPERALADKILAELVRARAKFPGKNVTFAALVEEVGELATATFEESADRVEKEAVQVAVMAMRMVLDGDHCFDSWRADKGLDPLNPADRAALSQNGGA